MMPAYKDKKRGTWFASFHYKDWTGKRIHTYKRGFATKTEALRYEKEFLDSLKRSSDISFATLVTNYLEYIEPRVKPTTMSGKVYMINSKILPYFEKLRVCDIDSFTIIKWQNELMAYRDNDGKPYSQSYLRSLNAQLATIFNFAMRNYGLLRNPCSAVKSMGKKKSGEMNFWTKEQYDQFSEYEDKPSFKVFFDVLFYTGLRVGEALALTYDDILPDKRIDVNKNYAVVDGYEVFLTPKNEASVRTVSIPDFLYDEIQEYVNSLFGYRTDERIFYFTKSGVQKEIHRVAKIADLPEIRVHDLRHSHASLLVHMGFDIMEISRRLGHSSVKLTWDVYSHLYPHKDVVLANRLNELKLNELKPSSKDEIEEELSGDD